MTEKVMIDIQNVSKKYKIGQINGTTLQHELQTWWAERKGREDPNSAIGSNLRRGSTIMALKDVSLKIHKGEAIGIIGKNGAGKSTLLKLISQVTAPTTGVIDVYGRITTMLEVGTGFDRELTGRENIYFNGSLLGMSKKEIDKKIDDIIAFSELEKFIDTPVKRYSSGMYTKLGFSVAVSLDSDIIIIDEVLAVGDYQFQNKCIRTMTDAAKLNGRTVLCVSHNMQHIRQLCDRCVLLRDGQIIFDGAPDRAIELYLDQEIREAVKLDYSDYERPFWLNDRHFFALSSEYIGHQKNTFQSHEKPRVRIMAEADKIISGVSLRIEIRDTFDVRIGTFILYDIIDIQPEEICEIIFDYPIDFLASGIYNVVYCFFVRDALGNNQNIENVPGMSFYVDRKRQEPEVEWDRKEWGNVIFTGAEVVSVSRTGRDALSRQAHN